MQTFEHIELKQDTDFDFEDYFVINGQCFYFGDLELFNITEVF